MNTKDTREMMNTAALLERRGINLGLEWMSAADDADELHALARRLHRYDERGCSEDLGCPHCDGNGTTTGEYAAADGTCRACAGRGRTTGRREAKAESRAAEIAARYRMRTYFQGDCRGCPLYLIPEEAVPADRSEKLLAYAGYASDKDHPPSVADLQARWVSSNYNSAGVPVCH